MGQNRYGWNTGCDKVADQAKMLICELATKLQITTLTLTYVLCHCLLHSYNFRGKVGVLKELGKRSKTLSQLVQSISRLKNYRVSTWS